MGAFKKNFLSPEQLQKWGPQWALQWQEDAARFTQGELLPAEFCSRLVLTVYKSLFGSGYRNGKRKEIFPLSQPGDFSSLNELARYRIRALPEAAELALLRWAGGEIRLEVFERIPTPLEVLKLQQAGVRCLSVFYRERDILNLSHEGRDFFSFLIHDLIHAQLMTVDQESYRMQVKFARLIGREWGQLNQGLGNTALRELEYMASDMNSHIVHLTHTFKSWLERHRPDLCKDGFDWMQSFQSDSMNGKKEQFQSLWNELDGEGKMKAHIEIYELWKSFEL